MLDDPAFADTNVLVYALFADTPHHQACLEVLRRVERGVESVCLSPQTIAELYATITNPRRVSNPYPPGEAVMVIEKLLAAPGAILVPMPPDLSLRMLDLLRHRAITGAKVFDVQIVATMLGNGIRKIYTFNEHDFSPFEEIEVLPPSHRELA